MDKQAAAMHEATDIGTKLTEIQRLALEKTPADDAYWTSDIALDARMRTSVARPALTLLEGKGFVERVVTGNPTSWRLTEAGRALLRSLQEKSHG